MTAPPIRTHWHGCASVHPACMEAVMEKIAGKGSFLAAASGKKPVDPAERFKAAHRRRRFGKGKK